MAPVSARTSLAGARRAVRRRDVGGIDCLPGHAGRSGCRDLVVVSGRPVSLSEQLCFALYEAVHAVTACSRPLLAPLGLTHTQYLVMLAIWEHQTITMGHLGQRLGLDSGTLTPLTKRLEHAELIRRRRSGDDERVVELWLTNKGWALQARAASIPARIAQATGLTPAEVEALRNTLQELTMRLRAAELRPGPP